MEQTNAKEIEILKNRENKRKAEKIGEEIENVKRDQMVAKLDYEIEKLEDHLFNIEIPSIFFNYSKNKSYLHYTFFKKNTAWFKEKYLT